MATASDILKVRIELADTDIAMPILTDTEYNYFLDKNGSSIRRTMLDAAKTILFKLSLRTDQTVDIFTIKGSKAAEQYRSALHLFIKNPSLNPALTLSQAFAGGVSISDMQDNLDETDNNAIRTPLQELETYPENYFEV